MTIRHLKTFIAVCEYGGITRAAEALHVAQPAVSQTIAEIEKFYNVILFDRLGKRLILTDFGKQLLVKAKETAASFDDFENLANKNALNNRIRIGASLTVGKRFAPLILNALRQNCPEAELSVKIDNTAVIEESLLGGDLDFAFVEGKIDSFNLRTEIIAHDRLVAVCAGSFPVPATITVGEFSKYPMLLRERGSASRDVFDGIISANGLNVHILVESASNSALISCAEQGAGIAVLPEALVNEYISARKLKEIKTAGCNFERNYYRAYHKNKRFSPLQEEVLTIAESVFDVKQQGLTK